MFPSSLFQVNFYIIDYWHIKIMYFVTSFLKAIFHPLAFSMVILVLSGQQIVLLSSHTMFLFLLLLEI